MQAVKNQPLTGGWECKMLHLADFPYKMVKDKEKSINSRIQQAVKKYFKGDTSVCYQMLASAGSSFPDGQSGLKLKKRCTC